MITDKKTAAIEAVETLILYKFNDPALLWEAINTRAVASPGHPIRSDGDGNKRLAVIGDSVLQLALAEDWYKGGTNRGHWAGKIISKIGANAYLDQQARTLGLERFIQGDVLAKKAVADTVEAILGAIYLDSGMANAKEVVMKLDLLTPKQRMEKELDAEGFVELDEDMLGIRPRKRQRTQGSPPEHCFRPESVLAVRNRPKKPLRLGHGSVQARLGPSLSLPPSPCVPERMADTTLTSQLEFIEIPD